MKQTLQINEEKAGTLWLSKLTTWRMRRRVKLIFMTSGVPGFKTGVGLKPFGKEKIPSFFRKAVSCLTLLHDVKFGVSTANRKLKCFKIS